MANVIKKGGKRQAFNATKIKRAVERALKEAKVPAAKARELMHDVADAVIAMYKNKAVRTSALRKSILRRLDRRAKSVSAVWRRFERRKKR